MKNKTDQMKKDIEEKEKLQKGIQEAKNETCVLHANTKELREFK